MAKNDLMDRVVNLAKRRGLVFPSSEIYGGFRSTWDYGPLGVLLKRNVKDAWWRRMVQLRDDIVGLDAAILMAPKVWEASGHVATFTDPLVDCRNCKERFRADQLPDSGACPNCGMKDTFTEARQLQPDVQDLRRPGGGRRLGGVPAPGDRAGHLRQLRQRADDDAQEAAVRHRPDRQVVPQRDHAGQLRVPHPRVRADGDGVLRAARGRRAVVRVLVPGAVPLVHRPRHPRGPAPPAPARHRGAVALLGRHLRRGVPLPVGLGRARGHRQPHRLRPHPAQQVLRSGPDLLRPGARPPVPPARDRAGRRRRPRHARLPPRRLRGGGRRQRQGRHREADGAAPAPPTGPDQGRGAAAVEERAAGAGGRRGRGACSGRS